MRVYVIHERKHKILGKFTQILRTTANIRINLIYCENLESLGYIFIVDSMVYLHSNFRGGLRKTHVF